MKKVRKRALRLVATWTADFEKDTTLGIMEDCYNNLKAKSECHFCNPLSTNGWPAADYKYEAGDGTTCSRRWNRRKEEEELQRVLELSMHAWSVWPSSVSHYCLASATSSSTTSKSASGPSASSVATASSSTAPALHPVTQPKYSCGDYAPARTPSPVAATLHQQQQRYQPLQTQPQPQPQSQTPNHASSTLSNWAASSPAVPAASTTTTTATPAADVAVAATSATAMAENGNIVTRVRALHTFETTEAGELAFEKGDIIIVVDLGYKDWWRGQLKGRTVIFPANYMVCFMFLTEVSKSLFTHFQTFPFHS